MEKNFLSVFAIASLMLATSCSNNELDSVQSGNETNVSFTAQLPDGLQNQTRATYGDGQTATTLSYAVYEVNDNGDWSYLPIGKSDEEIHMKKTVSLRLTNGNTYAVVFWADAPNSIYTLNTNAGECNVTADYANASSNDESLDAFFAIEKITVNGSASRSVDLKRPFAQLNIGTADLETSKAAGHEVKKAGVKVKTYNTLNFKDKTVSGESDVTFAIADLPQSPETFPVDGYDYLTMNYLLMPEDKKADNAITIIYDNAQERTFQNVPLQRNYRTNIYGNLLTTSEDFNVEIKPGFDGSYNEIVWDGAVSQSLAVDADGNYLIGSPADFAYLMQNTQQPNSPFIGKTFKLTSDINLAGKAITGVGSPSCNIAFTFDGNNHTIRNFSITTETDFYAGLFNQFNGTVKNLTVKDATVTGNKMAGVIASNVDNGGVIENCHVENCTITATIKKAGAITGYTAGGTVKGCTAKNCTVYCADANENESGEIVGYINTNSTIENNTATNVTVIRNYQNVEIVEVASVQDLLEKVGTDNGTSVIVATNKYIVLKNDIDCSGVTLKPIRLDGTSVFDGNGHKMTNVTAGEYSGRKSIFNGEFNGNPTIIVKNLTIDGVTADGGIFSSVLFGDIQNGGNVTIDGVHIYNATVKNAETVGGFVGLLSSAGTNKLSIKNSSINNSTIIGTEEVGKIGALVGRATVNYTCSGVVVDNVKLYNSETPLTTAAHGIKSEGGCTGGYTIK